MYTASVQAASFLESPTDAGPIQIAARRQSQCA